jgi:hypothetical protein
VLAVEVDRVDRPGGAWPGLEIEKRLLRGKKVLASATRLLDLADDEFAVRLAMMPRCICCSTRAITAGRAVRAELCDVACD